MELILTVLQIVAPVFLLAAVGFAWVKIGWEYEVEFVTRIAMTLSVPALIFVALMKADISRETLSGLFMASLVAYIVLAIVFWIVSKVMGLDLPTFWAPLIFGNTGNLGLPLALFAFGENRAELCGDCVCCDGRGIVFCGCVDGFGRRQFTQGFSRAYFLGNNCWRYFSDTRVANASLGDEYIGINGANGDSNDVDHPWCCIGAPTSHNINAGGFPVCDKTDYQRGYCMVCRPLVWFK